MDSGWLLSIGLLICALLEAPLFVIIAAASIYSYYSLDQDFSSIETIIIELNRLSTMPVLMALPLFTLAGCILTKSQAPKRIMNFMHALLGWLPGGLGVAALCSCAFFTALTGASGVTIVALGGILYPILIQKGYQQSFTLGLLTTSGSRGLLFPPSLPIILYGVVSQLSIDSIYKAALAPGLLMIFVVALYIIFFEMSCNKNRAMPDNTNGAMQVKLLPSLKEACWDLPIIGIIILGVYGGFTTVSEISVIVVTYIVLVYCFIKKEISWKKDLSELIAEATILSGSIIVILGFALGFTGFLVLEEVPQMLLEKITEFTQNKFLFLAGLNVFLLFVGCIMDIFSAIIIIVPIIAPIATEYGIHPIHLCIIFLCNLEIGYSTPPVGINLFIASLKFNKPVTDLYKASLPYLALLILVLLAITYIPLISTFTLN